MEVLPKGPQKENVAHNDFMTALINKILETSKVIIPDEILDEQVASRRQDVVKRMEQSGLTLEQYLSLIGQKEEQFLAQLRADTTREVTNYFLIDAIGEAEKLVVGENEIEEEMKRLGEQYGMSTEDVKKALAQNLGSFVDNLKMRKIEKFLEENN